MSELHLPPRTNSNISDSSTRKPQTQLPPQPFVSQPRFHTPSTFLSQINRRLDNALVSLFRLGVRILQLIFALASGISYALELSHRTVDHDSNSAFIYAMFVFGLTLLTLILDAFTIRTYKAVWLVEWLLAILYMALFATFYTDFIKGPVAPQFAAANLGRMERAVWMDLINFLLWLASAIFSSAMCCSGMKASVRAKLDARRMKKEAEKQREMRGLEARNELREMEQGTVRRDLVEEERLPDYEEVPVTGERH